MKNEKGGESWEFGMGSLDFLSQRHKDAEGIASFFHLKNLRLIHHNIRHVITNH